MDKTLPRRLEASDAERMEQFLLLNGYRRCDIAACNCGSWHGGHARARLNEIREAFEQDDLTCTKNKTLLNMVVEVLVNREDLKKRIEMLEFNNSSMLEQKQRAEFNLRLAENERDSAEADAKEAWKQFYELRKMIAKHIYPNLINEVK